MFLVDIVLLLLTVLCSVKCSHFRGGLITWKPIGTNQIEISYRIAFRRSSGHACTEQSISNGTLLPGEGTLNCLSGCSSSITQMAYYCTDFSVNEDWTTGMRTINYTLPASNTNIFHFGYSSCCWISLAQGGSGSWFVRTIANLNTRHDTGKINSSPTTGVQPIIRFSLGCNYQMKIPVADDDGDVVRCRWAKSAPFDECGGVCQTFIGSVLDEDTCTFFYNASGPAGWYAVAIQIEDFVSSTATAALSSVPLQFLVLVSQSSEDCSSRPVFPPNVITDGSIHHLLANQLFNLTIIARSGSASLSVAEITTLSPQGMIKSDLYPHGTSGEEWFIYVTWTPTLAQTGNNIFCFSATDNIGQTSDQVCATLVVHGDELPPTVKTTTRSSHSPTGTIKTTTKSSHSPTATVKTTTDNPQNPPINQEGSTESGVEVVVADPNDTVNYGVVAGATVGGIAVVGVTALGLARFLGFGRSAKVWGSGMIPDRSRINTNVTADNFNSLHYKSDFVSTTPAASHTFTR